MKKLSIISAGLITAGILCTGVKSANAQDVAHKLSFGVNIGVGIPGGDFSKADGSAQPLSSTPGADTSKWNGFAKSGFNFDVYGTYMFSSHVGAMLSLGGTMNSYDIVTLNTLTVSQGAIVTESGSYFVGQYLIGPYLSLPLGSNKLSVEVKGLVGLATANYPTLTYTSANGSGTIAVKSGSGFGYRVGAGLKYMLTDMIGLHLDAAYTGSSISYSSYTQSGGGFSYTDSSPKTMSLSLIQITVGASVDL